MILVDDQPRVLRGLKMRLALEPDMVVVGEAEDGAAAIQLAQSQHPDVIVMDVEMPGVDGISATKSLALLVPGCRVVVLSLHDDPFTAQRAREAGAVGFVSKRESEEALITAIRQAPLGQVLQ